MPGRDGYDVALHVRRTARLAHIPVILLTGAFDPVDHARAREAGCAGVLVKPFDPQMLVARVRQLLEAPTAGDNRCRNVTARRRRRRARPPQIGLPIDARCTTVLDRLAAARSRP